MPDITTTEGREELRRLIPPHGSKDIQAWAHPALDGLDIAEGMAEVLEGVFRTMPLLADRQCMREVLRRWQDWQGVGGTKEER